MVRLNNTRLLYGIIATIMIISGTFIRNNPDSSYIKKSKAIGLGKILLISGYCLFGYLIGHGQFNDNISFLAYLPMLIISKIVKGKKHQKLIDAASWISISYMIINARRLSGTAVYIAYITSLLAFMSVDSKSEPGHYLTVSSLISLFGLNAIG